MSKHVIRVHRCSSVATVFAAAIAIAFAAAPAAAQRSGASAACNQPAAEAIVHVELPGTPFEPIPTSDGCWIFVSMPGGAAGGKSGIAVLKRGGGKVSLVRVVPVEGNPTGMVLTHDGKTLVVAGGDRVTLLDPARLVSGEGDPVVGNFGDGSNPGIIYVNMTADDRFLFVALEGAAGIAVVDLAKARAAGFGSEAVVGRIPVGRAPIAVTLSSDERYLFTTSQAAPESFHWPVACKPESAPDSANAAPDHANGAIIVVDVARAKTDPAKSIVGAVRAGCNPVRLVLSPKGDVAYVSARKDNALLAFDTKKLVTDSAHALLATVPVGTAPVGIAVIDQGRRIVVTNSNRFAGDASDKQSLTVIDATKITAGAAAVVGSIPAGSFPRELRVTADGRTLLVSNFRSKTLEIVDLARLPLQPPRR